HLFTHTLPPPSPTLFPYTTLFRSRAPPPLIRTPMPAARERPETSATGTARISGHGVATTSTASARAGSSVASQAPPASSSVSMRSEEHTSELQSRRELVCRLLLEK